MSVQTETIKKTFAGKQQGSLTYVLSDDSVDRYGDIIEPDGWDLRWFKQNPIALFGHRSDFPIGTWKNVRITDGKLIAELEPAQRGTSNRVDEILSLIEQNILRATSVGFRSLHNVPLNEKDPYGAQRYLKQELLETSVVSVPANPAALQIAKSMNISDDVLSLAFGEHAGIKRRDIFTGEHAAHQSPTHKGIVMSLSRQIEEHQSLLNVAQDNLAELVKESDYDEVKAAALNDEIDTVGAKLASMVRTEKSLALRAVQQPQAPAIISRRPLDIPKEKPNKRDFLWRAAAVHFRSRALQRSVEDILQEFYPDDVGTAAMVRGPEWLMRAAVAGATTTAAGWAAELVYQAPGDFMSNLLPTSVFPQLSGLGTQLNFGPNAGSIKIPSRATTPSIGGSFVAEAQPIPVRRLGLTSITLIPHKVGGLAVYSREIAKYSNPQIETIIREGITDDTAINIDGLLLDAVAESATRPAGLTNGVVALTATTGGGYAAILGDLGKLTAPFYAVNAGRRLALLMNPAQMQQLIFAPGPSGVPFGWTDQFTNRFTVIESTSIAAGKIYMIDAADFVSVSGAAEFDVSETATLHMEDTTPANISAAGTPNAVSAPVQSMFQTAQVAIRMLADVTWAMRRTGMVQFMTGVNWGP